MLEFILRTNGEEIINEKLDYTINNNIIRFRFNNETYKFNISENIFTKLNKDTKVTIDLNKKLLIIDLLDINEQFMNGIEVKEVKKDNNIICFKYVLLDDEEKINEIYIKY